jgi:predicted PurR-regulated permease PerM
MHPVIVLAATAVAGIVGGMTLMILAAPVTATVIATARRIRAAKEAAGVRDPATSEQGLLHADTAASAGRAD